MDRQDLEQNRRLDIAAIGIERTGTIGRQLVYLPEVDSTNRVLRERAADAPQHGSVVITDFQTGGKGRLGRAWFAPPMSSVLLSVALGWPAQIPLSRCVMLAALATRDAIADATGLRGRLKWPNDILIDGKKVCGILAESGNGLPPGILICGIGINVNFVPSRVAGVPSTATSLACELQRPVARESLVTSLFKRLEVWYRILIEEPLAVFTAWSSALQLKGRTITVEDASGVWEGVVRAPREDGALLVRKADGSSHLVYAATVSVRGEVGDFTTQ